jgi:hypothetical protein
MKPEDLYTIHNNESAEYFGNHTKPWLKLKRQGNVTKAKKKTI